MTYPCSWQPRLLGTVLSSINYITVLFHKHFWHSLPVKQAHYFGLNYNFQMTSDNI